MKKPIMLVMTDLHISPRTAEQSIKIVKEGLRYAKEELSLERVYVAGDVFDSRKAQSLDVLHSWLDVLNFAEEKDIELRVIPGNHDKVSYESHQSYLDVFSSHSKMTLVDQYQAFDEGGYKIHMIPFFDEKTTYPQYLANVKLAKSKNILITHVAVDGVRNNDGSLVEEVLNQNNFSQFDKVLVGHYHDRQQVGDNIYYIGSIYQKNYGEDTNKGFTIVNDDGSLQYVKSDFVEYETIKVDLDDVSTKEVGELCKKYSNSKNNVRIKFSGSREKILALDKSKFDLAGIDVKCEYKEINVDVSYQDAVNFGGFDSKKILAEWDAFAKSNEGIDKKQGKKYLKEIL